MKEEYPPRALFDDDRPIWWDDDCTCGHIWSSHRVRFLSIFMNHCDGKCEYCQCPKFKLDIDNPSERRKFFANKDAQRSRS